MGIRNRSIKLHPWIAIACVTAVFQIAAAKPALAYFVVLHDSQGNYAGCAHYSNDTGVNNYTYSSDMIGEFFCWYLRIFFSDALATRPDVTHFTDANGKLDSHAFFNHFEFATAAETRAAVINLGQASHSQSIELKRLADELEAANQLSRNVGAPEIAAGLARIARLPPPPPAVISSCSPSVAAGDEMCVCGSFPAPESGWSLQLGGQPLGTPEAQSRTALFFRVPQTLAAGSYSVTAAPGTAAACSVAVLSISSALDVQSLELTGESFLYLRVLGTTDPVELRIENRSPTVVLINGSNFQRIMTSGGVNNLARRRLRLLKSGTLDIAFEIVEPSCPCALSSVAGNQSTGQAEMIKQLAY